MMNARARTETGLPFAEPDRIQATASRRRNTMRLDSRSRPNSSTRSASLQPSKAGMGHVLLFVEAREVGFLAAADAEGAVAKDALGVANVAEYLSCAPLPRRVAERLPIP